MGESKKNSKNQDGKKELGQVVRFAIVGVSNFLVDFIVYNLLLRFTPGISAVWAGIISGTAAMINSFIFNKNFTFRAKNLSVFRLVLFFVITAFGLYAIRPLIIYFFTSVWLWPSQVAYDFTSWLNLPLSQEFDTRNVALLFAIVVVLFYNYLMYKYFVFKDEKK
jgi:putative flippase GtrA